MKQIKFSELCNFSEKQLIAHKAVKDYKYVLYGGAMGGGKSYWLRWELVCLLLEYAQKGFKKVAVGLFCEDYPTLKDRQLTKIENEFPLWLGKFQANHRSYGMCFELNRQYGGGVILFRNLDDPSKYQSAEFASIAVDELTKDDKNIFDDLAKTRLRWKGMESKDCKFIAGTNPGGKGHSWVKKWWLDRDFEEEMQEKAKQFAYIPAVATDNPHLTPEYWKDLDSLPEDKRKAYKDGDWNIFKGQYFSEFRTHIHTCKPFDILPQYKRFICGDYGFNAPAAVYWCAIDGDGVIWVYRELYKTGLTFENLVKEIIAMTPKNELIDYWVFDPAIWAKKGETELSGAEIMMQTYRNITGNMLQLLKGINDRLNGWAVFREYLKPILIQDKTIAKLQIFETCTNAIRTISSLVYDEHKQEDCDSGGEDHAADSIRYGLMSRPIPKFRSINQIENLLNKNPREHNIILDLS